MVTEIETDYLVIGAGATAMAFVDTLLTESDATVVLVDRYHQPGGHWTVAYPYVRLHQPSAMYGVNSRPLGNDTIDQTGGNAGFYELASASEICSYFDQVMRQTFLPSGRVSYFPMAEYDGGGRFHLTTSGDEYQVTVRRKIVDTTYQGVTVPAMQPPEFPIAAGVRVVPLTNCRPFANPMVSTSSSAPEKPGSMPASGCWNGVSPPQT
ncbi:NAD(P)-binding protein [Nonomuraea antimicrobica]